MTWLIKNPKLNRTELTFEEFCEMPMQYTIGMNNASHAHRMWRNDQYGVQREVITQREHFDEMWCTGWKEPKRFWFLDDDPRTFRSEAECYEAYMATVCKVEEPA